MIAHRDDFRHPWNPWGSNDTCPTCGQELDTYAPVRWANTSLYEAPLKQEDRYAEHAEEVSKAAETRRLSRARDWHHAALRAPLWRPVVTVLSRAQPRWRAGRWKAKT